MEIKRGDIYFANLSPVVGSEQGGIRPVLIVQNDVGNRYSPTVIVAAITSRRKRSMPTHVHLLKKEGLPMVSTVMLEHLRAIDRTRLTHYIGRLDGNSMADINKAISVSLGLEIEPKTNYGYR
ncbi:MAG: type II toxin-antitoxin system PemK/MazF family toxin [Butyrivibrio sp.]|nr:type II toxin-antitoxin system PemK/MazF family toxin [Butyrivibrio sp.]